MDQDVQDAALMAQQAYRLGNQQDVNGWKVDPGLSNSSTTVYHNPEKNSVTFAHRGTDPNKIRDHLANGLLALGLTKYSNRYKRSENAVLEAQKKFGDTVDYNQVGHSAGGTTSILLGTKYKHRGHAFNPGFTPFNKHDYIHDGIVIHHVIGDAISSVLTAPRDALKNVKLYLPRRKNPHSLNNFIKKK